MAVLVQPGFQLLKARGQVCPLELVGANQLLNLHSQLSHLPVMGIRHLLDPRHPRVRSGFIDRQDF
ncbi:MAG: hypothetical protein L0099_06575, partial [Acidobacteria bacterium]|nr:hypothetical protein [Acidobacteriota bacterium]